VAYSAPVIPQQPEPVYESVEPLPAPPPQDYTAPVAPQYSSESASYAAEPAYVEQAPAIVLLPEQPTQYVEQAPQYEATWAPSPAAAYDVAPVQQEVQQSYAAFEPTFEPSFEAQQPQYEPVAPTASFDPYQQQQEVQSYGPVEDELQQYPDASNYGNRIRPRGAQQDRQF